MKKKKNRMKNKVKKAGKRIIIYKQIPLYITFSND